MDSARIHIYGSTLPATFLLRILNRMSKSTSETLRARLAEWKGSDLCNVGMSFDARVQLVDRAGRRLNSDLQRVSREFQANEEKLESCVLHGLAFEFDDGGLDLDLQLDVHGFLVALRGAVELLEEFLLSFFKEVLGQAVSRDDLRCRLVARGADVDWIAAVWKLRDLLVHDATPPLAVEIDRAAPHRIQLLLLQAHPANNSDFPGAIRLAQLDSYLRGLKAALRIVEEWLTQEIQEFEDRERPSEATHPGHTIT